MPRIRRISAAPVAMPRINAGTSSWVTWHRVPRELDEAGYRTPAPPVRRQPDGQRREPERGHRQPEDREAPRDVVLDGVLARRRDHSDGHRDHEGEDEAEQGELAVVLWRARSWSTYWSICPITRRTCSAISSSRSSLAPPWRLWLSVERGRE